MNYSDYSALPGVNISTLLEMLISPKQYMHTKQQPRPDTSALRLGRLVHTAVLEPMRLPRDYVIAPYSDWRTKEARAWREAREAAGQCVVTEDQYRTAERMREAVMSHAPAARYLIGGKPEHPIQWVDDVTGIRCKGRVDYLSTAVVDLKTTRHVSPRDFGRDAARLHYHTRMSWYRDGVEAATGRRLPVVIVAVQNEEPHDVACLRMPEAALDAGREVYRELLAKLDECQKSGRWPGACDDETDLELPTWAVGREETAAALTLTIGGKSLF